MFAFLDTTISPVLEPVPTANWVRGVVPPITPLNVTSPFVPGLIVKLFAPLIVDENVMLFPLLFTPETN